MSSDEMLGPLFLKFSYDSIPTFIYKSNDNHSGNVETKLVKVVNFVLSCD